jgi:hypothetical protein
MGCDDEHWEPRGALAALLRVTADCAAPQLPSPHDCAAPSQSGRGSLSVDAMRSDGQPACRVALSGRLNGLSFVVERETKARSAGVAAGREIEIEICTPERTRAWTLGAVGWASRLLTARGQGELCSHWSCVQYGRRRVPLPRALPSPYARPVSRSAACAVRPARVGPFAAQKGKTSALSYIRDGEDLTQATIRDTEVRLAPLEASLQTGLGGSSRP